METKPDSEKARMWQVRIEEQKASGLTKAGFCKEHRLSRYQFDYWLKRLKSKTGTGHSRELSLRSSFIRAQVMSPSIAINKSGLDPKWVAEFLLCLHGGIR